MTDSFAIRSPQSRTNGNYSRNEESNCNVTLTHSILHINDNLIEHLKDAGYYTDENPSRRRTSRNKKSSNSIWQQRSQRQRAAQSQTATKPEVKPVTITTNNFAEFFDKLDDTENGTLKTLQRLEKEIADANIQFKNAQGSEKSRIMAEIKSKQAEFDNIEKGLTKSGDSPSVTYGKGQFKYTNIDADELQQIQERNLEIQMLKDELAQNDKETHAIATRIAKVREEIIAKGGNPQNLNSVISQDVLDYWASRPMQIQSLKEKISASINNLRNYIKLAGASAQQTDYQDYQVQVEQTAKEEAAKNAKDNIGQNVIDLLYNPDGSLKSKESIIVDIKGVDKKTFANFNLDNIKSVSLFLQTVADNKTEAEFINYINSDEFLQKVASNQTFSSTTASGKHNLILLMQIVDSLTKEENFESHVNNLKPGFIKNILINKIKVAKEYNQNTPNS